MPQFYTLDEAARLLGATPDELKKMAERNEVRAFRDRGTLRFRAPEIEELARLRGRGSDPDLQLGETQAARPPSPRPQKGKSPSPPPQKTTRPPDAPEVFDFALDAGDTSDQVEIGQELLTGSSSKAAKPSSKKGPRTPGGKSPPPKPGSDSDVRLVADGSDLDFQIASDSDVKMVDAPPIAPPSPPPTTAATPPKRKTGSGKSRLDSGVQMVPLESGTDSDVKKADSGVSLGKSPPPKKGSDSDIRLDAASARPASTEDSSDSVVTDEIDLDAELRKAAESGQFKKPKRRSKAQPPQPPLPTESPFELSDADMSPADASPTTSSDEMEPVRAGADSPTEDSSSDFELTPAAESSSPIEPGSDEVPAADDEVDLGAPVLGAQSKSGVNLQNPADSGISLEQGGSDDSLEFELSLDSGSGATPKPAPPAAHESGDSSSEFELSLEEEPAAAPPASSDSEFELSLDSEAELEGGAPSNSSSPADSDSEFELTLDDSGGLSVDESGAEASGDQDIFETDFDVPSLEEESGSEAVALEGAEGEAESSDFDIALGDEDVESEDESGSQVVALEEGEGEAEAGGAVLEDSDEVEELFEGDEEAAAAEAPAAVAAAPAEWGPLPMAVMIPSVIVMFFVMLMSFELVRRDGTNNPNMVTRAVGSMFGVDKSK
jgi:excisionase family DNA binding protein